MSPFRTLQATADLLGRYRFVELAGFSTLGSLSLAATDDAAALALAGAARAHAFRALLIEERLPVSLGLPGVLEATRSPGPAIDRVFAGLADTSDADVLIDALTGALYPAMAESYEEHLASLDPFADPPIRRTIRRVLADLNATREELDAVAGARGARESATALRATLRAAGGPFGRIL